MAFSAISQAGYLVLAVMGGTAQGVTSLVFYLAVYLVANLGAFAVLISVEQNTGAISMDDYNGLYRTEPETGLHHDAVLVLARRYPSVRRFLLEILCLHGGFPRRLALVGARCFDQHGDLALLLLAHREGNVHQRERNPAPHLQK